MYRLQLTLLLFLGLCSFDTMALGQGRGRGFGGPGWRGGWGRGPDRQFEADRADFHFLLANHEKIRRSVKQLPNGVETVTESDDPEVAARIRQHVAAMAARVEHGRPIRMRDPLFTVLFRHADKIELRHEDTPHGTRVVETSSNPYVVRLIQEHAKVVSLFVQNGFLEAPRNHQPPRAGEAEAPAAGDPQPANAAVPAGEVPENAVQSTAAGPTNIASLAIFYRFDRLYIPVLALTNQEKTAAARQAMARLRRAWTDLRPLLKSTLPGDDVWSREVDVVGATIEEANTLLAGGKTKASHETLEVIRDLMMHARRRNRVEYALDVLSDFHGPMEEIVKPAMELRSADQLTAQQRAAFFSAVSEADRKWQVVERTEFDSRLFELRPPRQSLLKQLIRTERQAITKLQTALQQGDAAAILSAARGLKPPFARIYMSFGEFPQPPNKPPQSDE